MSTVSSLDPIRGIPALRSEGAQLKSPGVEQEGARKDVAVQFTSLLMSMVVKEMWKTTSMGGDGGGPFGSGPGADIYRGLAETAFAEALARNGMESLTEQVEKFIQDSKHDQETES